MGLGAEQGGLKCSRILTNPLALAGTIISDTGRSHLFDWNLCENGAGELGESVYGLKADFRWPAVGEGMSWVAVAMLHLAATVLRRICGATTISSWSAAGLRNGCLLR
jgi:hypothetical protein